MSIVYPYQSVGRGLEQVNMPYPLVGGGLKQVGMPVPLCWRRAWKDVRAHTTLLATSKIQEASFCHFKTLITKRTAEINAIPTAKIKVIHFSPFNKPKIDVINSASVETT